MDPFLFPPMPGPIFNVTFNCVPPWYIIAHKVLERLKNSKYKGHIDAMVQAFEKTVKYQFRNEGQAEMLTFGSPSDNERKSGIRKGQLKLEGCVHSSSCGGLILILKVMCVHSDDISSFFDAPVKCIVESVKEIRGTSRKTFTVRHHLSRKGVEIHSIASSTSFFSESLVAANGSTGKSQRRSALWGTL